MSKVNYRTVAVVSVGCVFVGIFCIQQMFVSSEFQYTGTSPTTGLHIIRDCTTFQPKYTVNDSFTTGPLKRPSSRSLESRAESKASFRHIANNSIWGGGKNHPSSTCYNEKCQHVIAMLHSVVNYIKKELGLSRVKMLDVPCGDMTFMPRFLEARQDVDYHGVEIVSEMIAAHRKNFAGSHPEWRFSDLDIIVDGLDESFDLVFNRQMLQHLYLDDALRFLHAVSASGSKFLFVTTSSSYKSNAELGVFFRRAARSRYLNLELPPMSLPPPLCHSPDSGDKFLALFRLPLKTIDSCHKIRPLPVTLESGYKYYTCSV